MGRPVIDMHGFRIGKLEVIGFVGTDNRVGQIRAYWKVRCDCGTVKELAGATLRAHQAKSCGCANSKGVTRTLINMVGQRFGKLVVVDRADSKPGSNEGRARWNVRCDCGTVKIVSGTGLRQGEHRSCGCAQFSMRRTLTN